VCIKKKELYYEPESFYLVGKPEEECNKWSKNKCLKCSTTSIFETWNPPCRADYTMSVGCYYCIKNCPKEYESILSGERCEAKPEDYSYPREKGKDPVCKQEPQKRKKRSDSNSFWRRGAGKKADSNLSSLNIKQLQELQSGNNKNLEKMEDDNQKVIEDLQTQHNKNLEKKKSENENKSKLELQKLKEEVSKENDEEKKLALFEQLKLKVKILEKENQKIEDEMNEQLEKEIKALFTKNTIKERDMEKTQINELEKKAMKLAEESKKMKRIKEKK